MKKYYNTETNKKSINNDEVKAEVTYSYYSNVLKKPFDSVAALKDAEEAYYAELKAKEDKSAQKKADARVVEDAFKCLNAARKVYKENLTEVTAKYREDLEKLKASFETRRTEIQEALAACEERYSIALKTFTEKYPEGYHLTLKDGDFETTISSRADKKSYIDLIDCFDWLFNF